MLGDFISGAIANPGATAVGVLSAISLHGPSGLLGIFNNQTVKPLSNPSGASSFMAVPQNSSGLGIFNNIANLNPFGMLTGYQGGSTPVQFNPVVRGGLAPASSQTLNLVKNIGLPVAAGALSVQAQGLTAGGYSITKQAAPGDNTLLYLGAGLLAAKMFKLF
jgi:hypothetical protein